jgi:type IV secretory pathway TraG/TraD family ATPase VirD4
LNNLNLLLRIFGFLLAVSGLLFLELNKEFYIKLDIFIISDLASYLPRQKKILGFSLVLLIYICFWYSETKASKIYKSLFWANLIALVASYCLVLVVERVPLNKILPYLYNGFKKDSASTLYSWITYLLTFYFASIFLFSRYQHTNKKKQELLVRGKKLISFEEAREISQKKIQAENDGVQFGWLKVPENQATTHFAVIGSTGSGKTLLIRFLLQSVLPRMKGGQDSRALIYDAKRDMLPILSGMKLAVPVITLHPFDKRGAAWDMAKDISSPASADQMATILIPLDTNATNPFFSDAARALMTGVITVFIKKCPEAWTFRDIILALKSATRLKQVLSECEETKDLIEQYFSNEKTANDVMSTLATKIQRYQYIAAAWDKAETKVSLKDWVTNEYILVIGNDEETRSAVDALNQVIFKRVSELVLNQSESFSRRTWVILDELKEAGMLPGLASLLSKGRSKGACVVIGFQDIEGLSASMKDNRLANEIVGLCANKAILRLDSAETARWASRHFGEQEVEIKKISTGETKQSDAFKLGAKSGKSSSTSESWINHKKEAVMPVEFLDLPPVDKSGSLHGFYIIPSIGTYYAAIKMSGENSILSNLNPIDLETQSYLARDKEAQFLRAWDKEDYERLRLSGINNQESSPIERQTDISNSKPQDLNIDLIKRSRAYSKKMSF